MGCATFEQVVGRWDGKLPLQDKLLLVLGGTDEESGRDLETAQMTIALLDDAWIDLSLARMLYEGRASARWVGPPGEDVNRNNLDHYVIDFKSTT